MKVAARLRMLVCGLLSAGVMFTSALSAAELEATLQWSHKAALGFPVSGVIVGLPVDVGDAVSQGDVLIQLDDRWRRAQLVALEAELQAAANNRDEAERELERTQELYDQTLLAEHDLQVAVIQRDAAEAAYQGARAQQVRAQLELEYSSLRAPFDGLVVSRHASLGQVVNSELQAQVLLELAESGQMLARVHVNEKQLAGFSKGRQLQVLVDGASFKGSVVRSGLEAVEAKAGRYAVDILFPTGGRIFPAGQAARVMY